jgi:hypothetical protein
VWTWDAFNLGVVPANSAKQLFGLRGPIRRSGAEAESRNEEAKTKPAAAIAGRAQIQFCDDDLIALICRTSKVLFH